MMNDILCESERNTSFMLQGHEYPVDAWRPNLDSGTNSQDTKNGISHIC
jgi:hypothetical protein